MKALTILCAVALSLCWAAFAYPIDVVTAHFSNAVTVGETTLPAGDVTITVQHGNPNVILTFRSESGVTATALATRISSPAHDQQGTAVVLEKSGAGFRVDKVWLNDSSGYALAQ